MLLAATTCAPLQARAAASAEEIEAAMEHVFDAGDYQRELPFSERSGDGADGEGAEIWDNPDWWRNEGETQAPDLYRPAPQEKSSSGFDFNLPPAIVEVLRVLMWVVLFAGGALILYYLLNEARLFSRWKKEGWRDEADDNVAGKSVV